MQRSAKSLIKAFTLVEIMMVVAILAMLASILMHNIIRARKRAQACKVLDDLRTLDGALDQWALDKSKTTGDVAEFSDISPYLKTQTKLNLTGYDVFGQPYGPFSVDSPPKVAEFTFTALSDVAPAEFWSPYY